MKVGVTARDITGQQTKFQFYRWLDAWTPTYPDDAMVASINALDTELVSLLQAVSDAGFQELMVSEIRGFGSAALTTGQDYPYCSDKAVFVFLKEDGGLALLEVPGPKNDIFIAGTDVVDLENANVASFTAAIINGSAVCDTAGNLYKTCLRAYRTGLGAKPKLPGGK